MPFEGLPVLEVEGKPLSQSNAILVYVGKEVGLYPTDNWEAAKVDEVQPYHMSCPFSYPSRPSCPSCPYALGLYLNQSGVILS
jgi:hypothetical protein